MGVCGNSCCNTCGCCTYPHGKNNATVATVVLAILAFIFTVLSANTLAVLIGIIPLILLTSIACTNLNRCALVTAGLFALAEAGFQGWLAYHLFTLSDCDDIAEEQDAITAGGRILKSALKNATTMMNATAEDTIPVGNATSVVENVTAVVVEVTDNAPSEQEGVITQEQFCEALQIFAILAAVSAVSWLLAGLLAFRTPLPERAQYSVIV